MTIVYVDWNYHIRTNNQQSYTIAQKSHSYLRIKEAGT